jgi:TPR repeat protein
MSATKDAGFVYTLAYEVRSQMAMSGAVLPTSREIEMIKKIAYEKDDPIALSVWGEVALKWGRTEEALAIYQHLNQMVYPSFRRPRYHEDIQFSYSRKAPWSVLSDMYIKAERLDEAAEMLKVGALTYRDPQALVTYAYFRKEKNDWEAYEQCLVAAAMSGHGEACFRLGNYYYLISKGEIPSRDQRTAEKHPIRAWIANFLCYFSKKMDWRRLAVNWYEMASAHGSSEGTRNFAVLMREDGHPNAWELMNRLKSDSVWWNNKNVIKLRDHWDNPKFKPTLLASWLEL